MYENESSQRPGVAKITQQRVVVYILNDVTNPNDASYAESMSGLVLLSEEICAKKGS